MIYPEFRLHSIAFAMRSVICCFIEFYGGSMEYKIITCFGTMIVADQITRIYAEIDNTTMRAMPFAETTDEQSRQKITLFHSKQQVTATLFMIMNMESAFSPMFAIQIAAFLMTLVRKNIIRPNTWHLLYSWSLMINVFVNPTFKLGQTLQLMSSIHSFRYFRMKHRINKYIGWSFIFAYMYFINFNYIDTLVSYQIYGWIHRFIVVIYLIKNIYATRALYMR